MKKYQEYRETTNSRVYRLRHKEVHASCSFCKWHPTFWQPSENQRYKSFHRYENGSKRGWTERPTKCPSWKLVSKNRKQWMPKKFFEIRKNCRIDNEIVYIEYIW